MRKIKFSSKSEKKFAKRLKKKFISYIFVILVFINQEFKKTSYLILTSTNLKKEIILQKIINFPTALFVKFKEMLCIELSLLEFFAYQFNLKLLMSQIFLLQDLRSFTVPLPGLVQSDFPTHARNNVKGVIIEVTVKRRLRIF